MKRLKMRRLLQNNNQQNANVIEVNSFDSHQRKMLYSTTKNSEMKEVSSNADQELLFTLIEAFLKIQTSKQKREIIEFVVTIANE